MNKADLVAKIAKDADIPKSSANAAIDSFLNHITMGLKKGQNVTLVGFGTFSVTKRKARTGRNPQTGQTIKIAARKVPKFKPGKQLRDYVNKGR
jgi:DNA-binding protein HU-beta